MRGIKMYKLSYSSISNYIQCPRKFKEVNVDYKFKDSSFSSVSGVDIHKKIEDYIKGSSAVYPLGNYDHAVIKCLRETYGAKKSNLYEIGIEQTFAVDGNYSPCDYKDKNAILRGKIDLYVLTPTKLRVIDWKSGKRRDNTLQATIYDILVSHLMPKGDRTFTFDYLSNGADPAIVVSDKDRNNAIKMIDTIQNAKEFPERPGPLCKWCPVPKAFCPVKQE